jgi:hypothetical protein
MKKLVVLYKGKAKDLNVQKEFKKQIDNIINLKTILYDLFAEYEDCEDIIDALRNLNTEKVITNKEYNFIMANYEQWLKEWEKINK